MLNHSGTSILITERFILRPFTVNDIQDMYVNWASSERVTKFLTWPAHRRINRTAFTINLWERSYENFEYYNWAIEDKATKSVIGSINLMNIDNYNENCEIGFCLGESFWNKGIMTEVILKIIEFAFKIVGFERLTARHYINNLASRRVLEKCNLNYEGTLRKIIKNSDGILVDCKYYSILKSEY